MKYKLFVLFSFTFVILILIQHSQEVAAVNYDSEIGLTFNNDVAVGSTQNTNTTSDTSTNTTSESSDSSFKDKMQYPETESDKPVKSGISSILPSAGYDNNNYYLILGFLFLIAGIVLLSFKSYITLKYLRK